MGLFKVFALWSESVRPLLDKVNPKDRASYTIVTGDAWHQIKGLRGDL